MLIYRQFTHRYQKIYKYVEMEMFFSWCNLEYRDSLRATIIPIWVGNQFRPVRVRSIGGGADLLLGAGLLRNCALRLISEIATSALCVSNGKWRVMTVGGAGRFRFPQLRGYTKSEESFRKLEIAIYGFPRPKRIAIIFRA